MSTATTSRLEEMKGRLVAVLTEAREVAAKAEAEDRDFNDDERAIVAAKSREATDLKKQLEKAKADGKLREALSELGDGVELNEQSGVKQAPSGLWTPNGQKTLGQHYTESAEFKDLLASAPGGHFSKQHRVRSRPTGYTELLPKSRGQKALVTGLSDTSGGAFVQNDWRGLQVGMDVFQRPLTIRDVVTNGTTDSDTIEYVRITSTTNNAAPVAEATSSGPQTVSGAALVNAVGGGYKPESGMAVAKVTTTVKTIAHWIPITKRALSDAAQMRTLIDNFLLYGLEEELEDQIVSGDGTGENLDGLANVSGTQSQAWDTDLLTTLRKARTKVRTVGRARANAYLLNPLDVEALDLLTDNEARYYFGGPTGGAGNGMGGTPTLWNLPVIESDGIPQGVGYVGDFTRAVLWDRQQAAITTTDSHMDFFVRNLVAILAESRHAVGWIQPSAFVEVDLTA